MTLRAVAQGGGGSSITLQTNGTNNASQSILNLVNGSNITITDGGGGSISIAASAGASTWDAIGAAVASKTTANANNTITYNTAPTTNNQSAWTFGETSAATNGTSTSGVPNQVLLKLATLAASTQSPLSVYSRGSHVFSVSPSAAQILATNGSSSNPPYGFAAAVNTGMRYNGTYVVISSGAFDSAYFGSSQVLVRPGSSTASGFSDSSSLTTGLSWLAGNQMSVVDSTTHEILRFVGGSANGGYMTFTAPFAFANLPAATDGSLTYCTDCDPATLINATCTSAGAKTGSFAARVGGAWICFT